MKKDLALGVLLVVFSSGALSDNAPEQREVSDEFARAVIGKDKRYCCAGKGCGWIGCDLTAQTTKSVLLTGKHYDISQDEEGICHCTPTGDPERTTEKHVGRRYCCVGKGCGWIGCDLKGKLTKNADLVSNLYDSFTDEDGMCHCNPTTVVAP